MLNERVNYYFGSLRLVKKEITIKKNIIYRARGVGCLLAVTLTLTLTLTLKGVRGFGFCTRKKKKKK